MNARMAESPVGHRAYHVVRTDSRYACGASRVAEATWLLMPPKPAHEVEPRHRCLRVGCSNDFAKADREASR